MQTQLPKMVQKVVNMVPKWVHLGAQNVVILRSNMEPKWSQVGPKNEVHLGFQEVAILGSNMGPTWSQVAPQKINLGAPMGRQEPPKKGPNLDPINSFF